MAKKSARNKLNDEIIGEVDELSIWLTDARLKSWLPVLEDRLEERLGVFWGKVDTRIQWLVENKFAGEAHSIAEAAYKKFTAKVNRSKRKIRKKKK